MEEQKLRIVDENYPCPECGAVGLESHTEIIKLLDGSSLEISIWYCLQCDWVTVLDWVRHFN